MEGNCITSFGIIYVFLDPTIPLPTVIPTYMQNDTKLRTETLF